MKKLNILYLGLALMIGMVSCQEDPIVTINPKAETGDMSFVLNQTKYPNYTYVLEEANNDQSMDALTCQQPDYGFTAAVNYTIQASFNENMRDSIELPSSVQGEKVNINVKEMNRVILQLYKGTMPKPSVAKTVYFRLKAVISTATPTPLDTIPTVKPLFSNVIGLNILPYYMQDLVPYYQAKKLVFWYVVGLGDGAWNNSVAGIGPSLMPMSVVAGNKYDSDGNGTFVYTGYIQASQGFKLIKTPGSWGDQWGNGGGNGINNPVMNDGGSGNFQVPSDGYYTVTLNTIKNTVTIEKINISPTQYSTIGLIGAMTSWGTDVVMQPFQSTNNHAWYVVYNFASDSQCKFRANSDWGTNWGTPSADDGDPIYSLVGIGVQGGKNMIETAGNYIIVLNDLDGTYQFIQK